MTEAQEQWKRCKPWIEAALATSPGLETIEDVEAAITDGRYQFWPGKACAAITEFSTYARKKVMTIVHGGGDLNELMGTMRPFLENIAANEGCDMILGTGREGWRRLSEKEGWRFGWIVMVKDLKQ